MTLTKLVHDVASGEVSEVELTAKEISDINKAQADHATALAAAEAAATQRAADRAALLTQLGITEEQAKLLLG